MYIASKIMKLNRDDIKYPKFKFIGRRFNVNGVTETFRKCKVCGKEFFYKGLKEPPHCGREGCEEFWRRCMQHQFMAGSQMVKDKEFFLRKDVVKKILNNARNVREVEAGMRREHIVPDQMIHRKVDRKRMVFTTFNIKGKKLGEI